MSRTLLLLRAWVPRGRYSTSSFALGEELTLSRLNVRHTERLVTHCMTKRAISIHHLGMALLSKSLRNAKGPNPLRTLLADAQVRASVCALTLRLGLARSARYRAWITCQTRILAATNNVAGVLCAGIGVVTADG